MHEGLKSYIRMLLEEIRAEGTLEEMGAASGGGNSIGAGAIAGYTGPLGSGSKTPKSRRKSRRLTHKK